MAINHFSAFIVIVAFEVYLPVMTTRIIPVDDFDLVIFGATGDLAQRKLLPALFHRD
jgi:Glucose-6-phosphate dehydrogenase, NAD binding domain